MTSPSEWVISSPALDQAQVLAAMVLLAGAMLFVPMATRRAWLDFRDADRTSRRLLVTALVLAALVRLVIAPKLIATVFIGYQMTQQAIDLVPVSHYGVGATAFYHACFAFLPHDHAALMWLNAVVGVLTIPLFAALTARLTDSRRIGSIAALLIALTPLFVRNDASDANNVPTLWWLMGALLLWRTYLDNKDRLALAGAASLFALAIIARPEMPVLAPLLLALVTWCAPGSRTRRLDFAVMFTGLVVGLITLPHVLHVFNALSALGGRGNLPGASSETVWGLPLSLVTANTLLRPTLFPVALVLAAGFGFFSLGKSRLRWALLLATLLAVTAYMLDVDPANMARVHVPAAFFLVMLAAVGVDWLWQRHARLVWRAGMVTVCLATIVPTALRLWAPTNEAQEEVFIRQALANLPAGHFTFVRLQSPDENRGRQYGGFTHLHFPDYLFAAPATIEFRSTTQFADQPDFSTPVYFFAGMRCYAQFRGEQVAAPKGDNYDPQCKALLDKFAHTTIVGTQVPNHGDVWIPYYGRAPQLTLALYRLTPPSR